MKKAILLLSAICSFVAFSQAPGYAWVKQSISISNPNVSTGIGSHASVIDTVNNYIYCVSGFAGAIDFSDGEHESSFNGGPSVYLVKYTLDGNLVWSKDFYHEDNHTTGMAIDGSGNLLITGYSGDDTVRFNNQYLLNADPGSDNDISYVVKLDGNGNTLWLKGSSNDGGGIRSNAITVDPDGNAYVTGVVNNPQGTFCGNNLAIGFFILKLNPGGTSQWFRQSNTPNESEGRALTIDHNGDCIIAGCHVNEFDLGSYTVPFNTGSDTWDRFLTKINASGTFQWAIANGVWQGPEVPYSVQSDAQNNIYLCGQDVNAPDPMSTTYTGYVFLEKRDYNGNVQWYKSYLCEAENPVFPTYITDVATSNDGTTYALFIVNDTTDFAGTIVSSNPNYATSGVLGTVVKYDNAGNQQWLKTTVDNTYFSYSAAYSISLDQAENVYFTGALTGSLNFDNIVATNATDPNYMEFFLAKLGDQPLGIDELKTKELLIYPNPSNGVCHLQFDGQIEKVAVFNSAGTEVARSDSNQLDLSGLAAGMYVVSVKSNNEIVQTKLVIR